jgi:hypothetical protein
VICVRFKGCAGKNSENQEGRDIRGCHVEEQKEKTIRKRKKKEWNINAKLWEGKIIYLLGGEEGGKWSLL